MNKAPPLVATVKDLDLYISEIFEAYRSFLTYSDSGQIVRSIETLEGTKLIEETQFNTTFSRNGCFSFNLTKSKPFEQQTYSIFGSSGKFECKSGHNKLLYKFTTTELYSYLKHTTSNMNSTIIAMLMSETPDFLNNLLTYSWVKDSSVSSKLVLTAKRNKRQLTFELDAERLFITQIQQLSEVTRAEYSQLIENPSLQPLVKWDAFENIASILSLSDASTLKILTQATFSPQISVSV